MRGKNENFYLEPKYKEKMRLMIDADPERFTSYSHLIRVLVTEEFKRMFPKAMEQNDVFNQTTKLSKEKLKRNSLDSK